MKEIENKISINEQEQIINESYKEIAECKGIELSGFFITNDDNTVKWIDLSEVM